MGLPEESNEKSGAQMIETAPKVLDGEDRVAQTSENDMIIAQAQLLAENPGVWKSLVKNKRAVLMLAAIMLNAILQANDGGIGGQLLGVPAFCKVMGNGYIEDGAYAIPAHIISTWSGVAAAPQILGQLYASYTADYFGRRNTMFILCGIILVGTAVELGANSWQVWAVAKFILAASAGIMQAACGLYISEMAPSELRGVSLTCFALCQQLGSLTCTLIAYGCLQQWPDVDVKWSYRVPIIVCLVLPVLVFVFELLVVVESPYWLLMRGRPEQAMDSVRKMFPYASEGELKVRLAEYQYILEKEASANELYKQTSIKECFNKKNLRRTFIAILPTMSQQLAGNVIVGPYTTYFFEQAGQDNSLRDTMIVLVIAFAGYIGTFFVIDNKSVGRYRLLMGGLVLMVIAMAGVGATATKYASPYPQIAGDLFIFFVSLGVLGANIGPGACGWTYAAEAGSSRMRSKTNSLGNVAAGTTGMTYNIAIAYMIDGGALGIKGSAFWFLGWGIICLVGVYIFVPDFTGRSYAEIDELFERKVPARQWAKETTTGDYGREIIPGEM